MTTDTVTVTRDPAWKRALAALKADNANRYGAPDAPFRWSLRCLSGLAECSLPETDDGREFLTLVADSFCETVEDGEPADTTDLTDLMDHAAHGTADDAVPVYTHRKWKVFVDVAAYSEDVSELVHGKRDLTGEDVANAALYLIADRLFRSLATEYEEKLEAELEADEEAEADATVTE